MSDKLPSKENEDHCCVQAQKSLSVTCSCSQCDSLDCFSKRHICVLCGCEACDKSNVCPYSANKNKLKKCYSDAITLAYMRPTKLITSDENQRELNQNDNNYELDREKLIQTNTRTRTTDGNIHKSLDITSSKCKFKFKPESLRAYIDIISENAHFKDKQESLKRYIIKLKESKVERPNDLLSKLPKSGKCKGTCRKCRNKNVTQVRSVMVSCPFMEVNKTTAALSAQVMNISYENLPDSISPKASEVSANVGSKKIDYNSVIKRLKEAYKACSCKVCECIPTKLMSHDVCDCKPCECAECTRYMNPLKLPKLPRNYNKLRCTCTAFNSECKNANKKLRDCSCEPCKCALCQNKDFAKPCDCEPCQCVLCKPPTKSQANTVIVAPVTVNYRHTACQCSPCECNECVFGVPPVSRIRLHEMSTDTNRHTTCECKMCFYDTCKQGVDTCKCERLNKIMTKPVEKDTHDFDIRRAFVTNNRPTYGNNGKEGKKDQDMITMFAALPNKYPSFTRSNIKKTVSCTCEECECITCINKEDTINAIKSSRLFLYDKRKALNHEAAKLRKQYQCPMNRESDREPLYQTFLKSSFHPTKFICDECSHFNERIVHKEIKRYPCKCSTCRCERCFGDEFLPGGNNKKGEILTPSAYQAKLRRNMAESDLSSRASAHEIVSIHKDLTLKRQINKIVSYHKNLSSKVEHQIHEIVSYRKNFSSKMIQKIPTNNNYSSDVTSKLPNKLSTATHANKDKIDFGTVLTKSFNECNIPKCDAFMQCSQSNKELSLKDNWTRKTPGSYISIYSSSGKTSKTSLYKETDYVNPTLENKRISLTNSCQNSGHKCEDTKIPFSKSTVETCLHDVMKSNLEQSVKLKTFLHSITPIGNQKNFEKSDDHSNKAIARVSVDADLKKRDNNKEKKYIESSFKYGVKYFDLAKLSKNNTDSNIPYSKHLLKNNKSTRKNSKTFDVYSFCKNIYCEPVQTTNREADRSIMLNNLRHRRNLLYNFSKYYQMIHNLNELRLDRNVHKYILNQNLPKYTSDTSMKPKASQTEFRYSIESLSMDEDYERVHNTLQDAKKFSLYLLEVLETYEKANKDFVKISDELKLSYASICAGESTSKSEVIDKNISKNNNEQGSTSLETPCLTETTSSLPFHSENELVVPENIISESEVNCNMVFLSKHNSNQKFDRSKKIPSTNTVQNKEKDIGRNEFEEEKNGECNENIVIPKSGIHKTRKYLVIANNIDLNSTNTSLSISKRDAQSSKRTITIAEKVDLRTSVSNNSSATASTLYLSDVSKDEQTSMTSKDYMYKNNEKSQTVSTKHVEVNKIKKTFDSGFESNDTSIHKPRSGVSKQPQRIEKNPLVPHSSPLQRSIQNRILHGKEKLNALTKNKLELELKDPQKANKQTGHRPISIDKEILCKTRSIPDSVEEHLREIMNDSVAQSSVEYIRTENTMRAVNVSSNSGVSEGHKVRFLVVRKVSDHTVLIKWSQPQERIQIHGYELLVDGRAVQKIFSPSKCMAVITCLPHNEKILLTIRTITSALDVGHYPTSTIIYRPRVK